MQKNHEIMFQVDANIKNTFSSGFMKATDRINRLQSQIKQFETSQAQTKALENSFAKLQNETQQLGFQWHAANSKLKLLKEQISATNGPTREQQREISSLQNRLGMLNNRLDATRTKQKEAELALRSSADSAKSLGNAYNITASKLSRYQKLQAATLKIQHLQDKSSLRLANANNAMMFGRSVMNIGSVMSEPINQTMKFESVMADIRKLVHFDTPQQFAEMGEQLKQLSTRVPIAVDGLGHIAAAAAQAGIAKDEIMQFTENAAQMGVAYNITADQAGDMMAKWRSGFHLTQTEVVKLADQINLLSDNSAASGAQIGEVVTRIGALGKIAGLTEAQVAALAATSIGAGVAPEIAATGIKKLMTTLTSSTAMTKSQAEMFSKLGVNVTQLGKNIQKDGAGAIIDVLQRIKKLAPEQQVVALKKVFGEESIAPIAGLMNNLPEIQKSMQLVGDSSQYAGSMLREFNTRSQTTENSIQLMKNSIANTAITIGNTLLPAINAGIKKIAEIVNVVQPWVKEHESLVATTLKVAAALGGVTIAVSGMSWLLSGTMAVAIKAIAAATWLWNSALLANPMTYIIGAAVVAVGALSYGIYELVQNWDDCVAAVKHFLEWLDKILEKFNPIYKAAKAIGKAMGWANDNKSIDINYRATGKNDLDSSVKQLMQNQSSKSNPSITYNAPQTINVTGANPQEVKQATAQASRQSQSDFDSWYRNARLAY